MTWSPDLVTLPSHLTRHTTSSKQFHEVMNSAHRIDTTTFWSRPRPSTGQHYTYTQDLAAYTKGSEPIFSQRPQHQKAPPRTMLKASPRTMLKASPCTMLKMAPRTMLKSASCTILGIILYHRVLVDGGLIMYTGRYQLRKGYWQVSAL